MRFTTSHIVDGLYPKRAAPDTIRYYPTKEKPKMLISQTTTTDTTFAISRGSRLTVRDMERILKEAKAHGVSKDAQIVQGGIHSVTLRDVK